LRRSDLAKLDGFVVERLQREVRRGIADGRSRGRANAEAGDKREKQQWR
jgi:hypothetical protein